MSILSFKDRGAAVLVSVAAGVGAPALIADSSGNAGAYAATPGLMCGVFVAESTSPGKLTQLTAHGAEVGLITSGREDAAKAAIAAVESSGACYASHAWHPAFLERTRTFVFELWQQLDHHVPDEVVIAVGNERLLLGAAHRVRRTPRAV